MRIDCEPIHEIDPGLVRDYLTRRGWPADLIEWKYFDSRFNSGRLRGFAWIYRGRVCGMIGMIPARYGRGTESWPIWWACDWSVEDHESHPGIGVLIFQKALESCEHFMAMGGNEHSLRYFPRLSQRTIPDAAVEYHLPLRVGALLEKAAQRTQIFAPERWPALARIPVPRFPVALRPIKVRTSEGVPSAFETLLARPRSSGWHPKYDFEHISWGVARCPLIETATSVAPSEGPPEAAVIFWRQRENGKRWRGSLWGGDESPEALASCLEEAIRQAGRQGGSRFTIMVSSADTEYSRLLKRMGFIEGRETPMFLYRTGPELSAIENPRCLSFHDSDYPVLF